MRRSLSFNQNDQDRQPTPPYEIFKTHSFLDNFFVFLAINLKVLLFEQLMKTQLHLVLHVL